MSNSYLSPLSRVALLILSFGSLLGCSNHSTPDSYEQAVQERPSYLELPKAKIISDFSFVDGEQSPFGLDNLKGKWSFVFFGFTFCPDICPPSMTQLATFKKQLSAQTDQPLQFFFASTDPERDTPDVIKRYARAFDPDFKGIVGDEGNLLKLATQVGVYYERHETKPSSQNHDQHSEMDHSSHDAHAQHAPNKQDYLINHTGSIIVFDPSGRYAGFFQSPHNPEKMVHEWLQAHQ